MSRRIENTWYILAPHLTYPLRNGADLYAEGVAKGISHSTNTVLVGASTITKFSAGVLTSHETFANNMRSKLMASLMTLLTRKNYQESKFITKGYRRQLLALNVAKDANIAFSYTSTAAVAGYFEDVKGYKVVLTHNFDIEHFTNLRNGMNNWVQKKVLDFTLKSVDAFLTKEQSNYLFAHNNESDQSNYDRLYPKMNHSLFKVGVDSPSFEQVVALRHANLVQNDTLRLCFTGYLNGLQNLEALQHFETNFWPVLLQAFGSKIEFYVIGSSPSQPLKEMVERWGWILKADLNDADFTAEVAACHYSVLPFPYTSGTKHKLFTSIARGVPFLATNCIAVQADTIPTSCLFSDEASAWVDCMNSHKNELLSDVLLKELHQYITKFSWQAIAQDFLNGLKVKAN